MAVYFGGSRNNQVFQNLPQVVAAVIQSGQAVHVGCQFGADQAIIKTAILQPHPFNSPSSFLFVFAVAPSLASSPAHVQVAETRQVTIKFSAGGQSAPEPARYLLRSIAAFQGCSQAVFFQPGNGSLAVARECLKKGLQVFAFGSKPAPIPSQAGQWVQSSFMGFSCWQWSKAQLSLF